MVTEIMGEGIMKKESTGEQHDFFQKRYFSHVIRTLVGVIDSKDVSTRGHSEKVMKYCARTARVLRLNKDKTMKIKIAALMHDIGKFRLDRAILNKRGPLTEKEWREVKKHPVVGAKIIKATGLFDDVSNIVRHHHERFGGGGYPNPNKKGTSIPLGSRMIFVADAYDAMTSKRPYRKRPKTKKEALDELKRCSGAQFDPCIVNAFIHVIHTMV